MQQELKVFRMADAIMDIMMCTPGSNPPEGMVLGAGDVLSSLQRIIFMVGGQKSEFFGKLQRRMGSFKMSALAPYRVLSIDQETVESDADRGGAGGNSEPDWTWSPLYRSAIPPDGVQQL